MRPVTVSMTARQSPQEVFALLNVLENHESFTDHFLVDWRLSGPRSGVGARARMRVKKPGPDDFLMMQVVAAERPKMTAQESVGAAGRRRTLGTYRLEGLPGGGTRISFELAWLEAPFAERLARAAHPGGRQRNNRRSLRRLVERLGRRPPVQGGIR